MLAVPFYWLHSDRFLIGLNGSRIVQSFTDVVDDHFSATAAEP